MTFLMRELYTAIFSMSCRDAQVPNSQQGDGRPPVPGDYNACVVNVGIRCGLHDHSKACSLEEQSAKLQRAMETLTMTGGSTHSTKRVVLCERRVTIDLFQLAGSILTRFGLECTNSDDAAFVGLLSLRNTLLEERIPSSCAGGYDRSHPQETKQTLSIDPGPLHLIRHAIVKAVELYSNALSTGVKIKSLPVEISLRLPRWVLLDMACTKLVTNSNVSLKNWFDLGHEAYSYLKENPDSLSFSFDTTDPPLHHSFCQQEPACMGGWAPCRHDVPQCLRPIISSVVNGPSTLDPWVTTTLPVKRAGFSCLATNHYLYVIGGSNGDADPDTGIFTTCFTSVYRTKLPLSPMLTWSSYAPELSVARRNHTGCVHYDFNGNPMALVVCGGRAEAMPGRKEGRLLSSLELLRTTDEKDGGLTRSEVPPMPCGRSGHHIVSMGNFLFVIGGTTEVNGVGVAENSRNCDIFRVPSNTWYADRGPRFPTEISGGSMIVVRHRFVFLFGGIIGSDLSDASWILDLKPWTAWAEATFPLDQRPSVGWIQGPQLPTTMLTPNMCLASCEDTGLSRDWILSVGPMPSGTFCFGMKLPPPKAIDHCNAKWTTDPNNRKHASLEIDLSPQESPGNKIKHVVQWKRLGAVPDSTAMGATLVTPGGVLAIIGGVSLNASDQVCNKVHFRKLMPERQQQHQPENDNVDTAEKDSFAKLSNSCPYPLLPVKEVEDMGPASLETLGQPRNQKLLLNDHYLIARLGFPWTESQLFDHDPDREAACTRKLVVLDSTELHCQVCLNQTGSVSMARAHNDTALFGIRASPCHTQNDVSPPERTRRIPVCSTCLCDLYYHSPTDY